MRSPLSAGPALPFSAPAGSQSPTPRRTPALASGRIEAAGLASCLPGQTPGSRCTSTGRPFEITGIRAGRKKPGLLRQHLTAVEAAIRIGGAHVEGAAPGSGRLRFEPGDGVQPGDYTFAVGTAGSAVLVLQTVLPALLAASAPSHLVLEGGTHNPAAPPFEFLDRVFLPVLRRMGVSVAARLERRGFYPAGGGRFTVDVEPAGSLISIRLNCSSAARSPTAMCGPSSRTCRATSRSAR